MAQQNGRAVPDHPMFVTSAGYTVSCRRISPDTPARLQAAAMRELADSRPAVPTETVAVGEDPRTREQIFQDFPRPDNPEYLQAFAIWEKEVRRASALKLRQLLEDYAVITEVDAAAVAQLRQVHEALGDPLGEETDLQVWLWRIVAPASEDQTGLMSFILGRSTPSAEAIQAQKDTFRSNPPAA
jgi:NAD dependent epimerase/dehydratase family enzyme